MSTRRDFLWQTAAASVAAAAVTTLAAADAHGATRAETTDRSRKVSSRTKPIRLAIVGTGEISPRYLKQAAPGTPAGERARFVATCARTTESAKARAVEYGIGAWFDDYKKMYDKIKPDAVVIATPHTLHAEQSLAALQRGIHVLVEKPMATSLDDCYAMVAAAQKSGAVLLALPYDATPPVLAALAHLNEPTLGVFTGAETALNLPGGTRASTYDRATAEGAMLSALVYPVSRLISLLGPARRVTGFVNTLIPHRLVGEGKTIDAVPPPRTSIKRMESNTDDNVTLLIEWPNGQQAVARSLWGTSFFSNAATIYCRHGTLWLSGSDVVIHSPERAIPETESVTWNGRKDCYKIPIKEVRKNEGLVDHFIDCIEGRAEPTCGGQQQLHVHEILFKGFEAARTGKVQDLQTTFTPWHPIDPAFHDTRSRFI